MKIEELSKYPVWNILSGGGSDSLAMLLLAKDLLKTYQPRLINLVSYDIGQKALKRERESIQNSGRDLFRDEIMSDKLSLNGVQLWSSKVGFRATHNHLHPPRNPDKTSHILEKGKNPSKVIPYRNFYFIYDLAFNIEEYSYFQKSEYLGEGCIWYGSGYIPGDYDHDSSPDSYPDPFNHLLKSMDKDIVFAPFHNTKRNLSLLHLDNLAKEGKIKKEWVHPCFFGGDKPCGKCDSCKNCMKDTPNLWDVIKG